MRKKERKRCCFWLFPLTLLGPCVCQLQIQLMMMMMLLLLVAVCCLYYASWRDFLLSSSLFTKRFPLVHLNNPIFIGRQRDTCTYTTCIRGDSSLLTTAYPQSDSNVSLPFCMRRIIYVPVLSDGNWKYDENISKYKIRHGKRGNCKTNNRK